MFRKKECVVMLLAGGQGSRLYPLTENTAKPSVSFGAKYRLIDFPLSNCANSGLDTVGIITQYEPLDLSDYLGRGRPWDLNSPFGGLRILPPYQGKASPDWYKGTANAIWQNMEFINRFSADYVLILSGDHIYKMDYMKMLSYHKEKNADCTVAVVDVPESEASRFGIMSADGEGRITKFTEKPKSPDSTKASMGIYVFTKDKLEKYLEEDSKNPDSDGDFGKNVIPLMLKRGAKLFSYGFSGYWKDVGTVDALWEANMDILGERPALDLHDERWQIYSRQYPASPQYIGKGARVENVAMTDGTVILGEAKNSVIGRGVKIEQGAVVEDSVLFDGVTIGADARVVRAIIDNDTKIEKNARIGGEGVTVVSRD